MIETTREQRDFAKGMTNTFVDLNIDRFTVFRDEHFFDVIVESRGFTKSKLFSYAEIDSLMRLAYQRGEDEAYKMFTSLISAILQGV